MSESSRGSTISECYRPRRVPGDMRTESSVMNLRQAAAYLQVSRAHLSNVINGKVLGVFPIRSFRVGRRVLIKREWIDEWLETADQRVAHS